MAYANALTALADPTRRRVFEELRSGPKPVGEIARELPVSRPAVSQHLKILKSAGLVTDRAELDALRCHRVKLGAPQPVAGQCLGAHLGE